MIGFNSFCVEWFISLLIYNITNEGQRLAVKCVFVVLLKQCVNTVSALGKLVVP